MGIPEPTDRTSPRESDESSQSRSAPGRPLHAPLPRCVCCSIPGADASKARGEGPPPVHPSHATTAVVEVGRSEEHTSELQSLMRRSYAVFCLKKKKET